MISNAMRAHVDALLKTAKGIVDAAKEQGRDLLESEAAEVTRCCAEVKRLRGDESSDAGAAQQIEREGGLREPFRVNVHFADRYPPGDPRRNQTPSDAEDGSGIVFRDAATGELTRALRSDERVLRGARERRRAQPRGPGNLFVADRPTGPRPRCKPAARYSTAAT